MPIYYFAYGSNMSRPQMQRRCPGAQSAGRCVLPDWRLVITVRGSANIRFQEGAATHGVLWRFEPHHIGLMDFVGRGEPSGLSTGVGACHDA